jgi:quercetin dioxygenase-like cupin family protein
VTRRVPQFENEHVRVWKSIIQPRQPLSMHRHDHPRALIALAGGELRIVKDSGASQTVNWETGKAYWLTSDPPNELHADVNDGDRAIEVIVVELQGVR